MMSYSGDAAEQVVRMTLEGTEVAAKITGVGAKQVAVILYAILQDRQKTSGKTRLGNMLKSGRELKVFAVKDDDLKQFCTEAKKYGVLYCVLKDKDANDGVTDIMVRAEDAAKINRIFERFQLSTVDMGSVQQGLEVEQTEPAAAQMDTEAFLDDLLAPKAAKDEELTANPGEARREKSPPSEPILKPREPDGQDISDLPAHGRPSVRRALADIKRARAKAGSTQNMEVKQQNTIVKER